MRPSSPCLEAQYADTWSADLAGRRADHHDSPRPTFDVIAGGEPGEVEGTLEVDRERLPEQGGILLPDGTLNPLSTPALFTRTSTRPWRRRVSSTIDSHACSVSTWRRCSRRRRSPSVTAVAIFATPRQRSSRGSSVLGGRSANTVAAAGHERDSARHATTRFAREGLVSGVAGDRLPRRRSAW